MCLWPRKEIYDDAGQEATGYSPPQKKEWSTALVTSKSRGERIVHNCKTPAFKQYDYTYIYI